MALVLSRKLGQSLIIGDTLEVALVRTACSQGVIAVSIHSPGAKRRKHTARLRESVKVDECAAGAGRNREA